MNNNFIFIYLRRDGLEDPLDDMGMVLQQLEQVSVIARCDYQKTCTMLVQVFDQTAALYQDLINSSNTMQVDLNIQESKCEFHQLHGRFLYFYLTVLCSFFLIVRLTWLVYIIGAAIGGRVSFNTNEEHDVMDGEMVVRLVINQFFIVVKILQRSHLNNPHNVFFFFLECCNL